MAATSAMAAILGYLITSTCSNIYSAGFREYKSGMALKSSELNIREITARTFSDCLKPCLTAGSDCCVFSAIREVGGEGVLCRHTSQYGLTALDTLTETHTSSSVYEKVGGKGVNAQSIGMCSASNMEVGHATSNGTIDTPAAPETATLTTTTAPTTTTKITTTTTTAPTTSMMLTTPTAPTATIMTAPTTTTIPTTSVVITTTIAPTTTTTTTTTPPTTSTVLTTTTMPTTTTALTTTIPTTLTTTIEPTTAQTTTTTTTTTTVAPTNSYLGCYEASGIRSHADTYVVTLNEPGIFVSECRTMCKAQPSTYTIVAMKKKQCFCNYIERLGDFTAGSCNHDCADGNECGASGAMSCYTNY